MNRSGTVNPKRVLNAAQALERQVKGTRILIRAADRALSQHAKKTRTVFIGREANDAKRANDAPPTTSTRILE